MGSGSPCGLQLARALGALTDAPQERWEAAAGMCGWSGTGSPMCGYEEISWRDISVAEAYENLSLEGLVPDPPGGGIGRRFQAQTRNKGPCSVCGGEWTIQLGYPSCLCCAYAELPSTLLHLCVWAGAGTALILKAEELATEADREVVRRGWEIPPRKGWVWDVVAFPGSTFCPKGNLAYEVHRRRVIPARASGRPPEAPETTVRALRELGEDGFGFRSLGPWGKLLVGLPRRF